MTDPDAAGVPADGPPPRDHPDVLAVCRWLPQPFPWGTFTGRHDHVHAGARQGFVNLWWSESEVHPGDYVGPPRGGLLPDPDADYDVAMPAGGYLHVRGGLLLDWTDTARAEQVLRADGEAFRPEQHGPARPYWLEQYRSMTAEDRLNALAAVRRRRLAAGQEASETVSDDQASDRSELALAIADWVGGARSPDRCGCGGAGVSSLARGKGMNVPGGLLKHGGAVATLAGMGDADSACEVVWSLTRAMSDPAEAGLVRAAEVAARRAAENLSGWPDGPLTEEAVALVAAQALRWHGDRIVRRLPFWTLGWIFVPRQIFDSLLPALPHAQREALRRRILDRADRVRVDRVMRTWQAAQSADRALRTFQRIADGDALITAADVSVIDLREPDPLDPGAEPWPSGDAGMRNGSAASALDGLAPQSWRDDAYLRSVEDVVAEMTR